MTRVRSDGRKEARSMSISGLSRYDGRSDRDHQRAKYSIANATVVTSSKSRPAAASMSGSPGMSASRLGIGNVSSAKIVTDRMTTAQTASSNCGVARKR